MSRILVVEDEVVIRSELRRLLSRNGHVVAEAGSVEEAMEQGLANFDLVITDLRLPKETGTALIEPARDVPVLIMTSFASVKSAVEAMKLGARDYVSKPFDPDEMLMVVDRITHEERTARRSRALQLDVDQQWTVKGMVAKCEAMTSVIDRVGKVAPTEATVLVLGESGTGKELIARAIHAQSTRSGEPFVAVNCAAIPDGLIESELFGHEKGAFTGASSKHAGLIETAHGGTLFLDEVGELPLNAQARLLRVLQESEIRHVGSSRTRKVDVRVVAATHRDLPQMIADGQFREDLYFRLRVVDIRIPPLRERIEDLPTLSDHLLSKIAHRVGRTDLSFTDEALATMQVHAWPGNVRELENAIERAVILCDGTSITPELLGLEARAPAPASNGEASDVPINVDESLEGYFKRFVLQHQGSLSETELAKRLGISRKALWERRQKLNLPRPKAK